MSINENQKSTREYKVYIHRLKTEEIVSKDHYYAYYRDIWALRKRAQYHGQCRCPKPKLWLCDGDCLVCEFRSAGDTLSLDYAIEDSDGNQKSWLDSLADDSPDAQSIMESEELLEALHLILDELNADEQRICQLIMEGRSERDIAATLGIPRNTYTYRRDKIFQFLRESLGPYYL